MAAHVESLGGKRKANGEPGGPPEKVSSPSVTSQAPRGINVAEFAEARALELHNMVRGISEGDARGSKRIFQSLPNHMRRRAVSHNVKRMPVRLRKFEMKEEGNKTESHKKKSRRQRRKTKALLDEYNRRKKGNIWLETHIWHAKRMKMVNVWGYRLAEHPSDKSFKACHRAVNNSCLLQDISYYCCIEIKGTKSDILSAMDKITRQELGPTIASVEYTNTGKEGHVMLYHPNEYPYGAIGPITFMWRQFSLSESHHEEQLWIWVHPSCYDEALKVIKGVCGNVHSLIGIPSVPTCDNETQTTNNNNNITVTSLQFDFARLRLTGPLAHQLLVEMLVLKNDKSLIQLEGRTSSHQNGCKASESSNNTDSFHQERQEIGSCNTTTEELWKSLKSVSCSSVIKPHSVLALNVQDPRINLPGKRSSIDATHCDPGKCNTSCETLSTRWPSSVAVSELWDSSIRQHVKKNKLDDHQLNSLRSNLLLPSSQLDLGTKTTHVPILLVQQPGKQGYGAGWDIILPAGWAMPFWISLVYRGARVGGLREGRNCSLESEVPYFPRDVPDTTAGKLYNDETQREGEGKFSRYPPNKRPNYDKLGFESPFSNPWSKLVKEWIAEWQLRSLDASGGDVMEGETTNKFSMIEKEAKRMKSHNDSLSNVPEPLSNNAESFPNNAESVGSDNMITQNKDISYHGEIPSNSERFYVLRDISKLKALSDSFKVQKSKAKQSDLVGNSLNRNSVTNISKNNLNALVAVSLHMANQGYPLPNATVALPTISDLKELQSKAIKCRGPTEPLHKGPRRHLSNARKNGTLIGSCTRDVIGFVTSGQYSLSRGHGVGIAYCALPGLVRLSTISQEGIVVVRNTSSQQYRFAYLAVL